MRTRSKCECQFECERRVGDIYGRHALYEIISNAFAECDVGVTLFISYLAAHTRTPTHEHTHKFMHTNKMRIN